jgi:tetratricopeptide (TPR) repeat protein
VSAAGQLDRARILAARGSVEEALEALEAFLADEPRNAGALVLKGALLLELREGEEALAVLRGAVEEAPGSAEAWNGLARCLHALARDEEALEAARRAQALLSHGENFRHAAPVYLTLLWCLREMRRYREALEVAEEGLSRWPDAILAQWASVVEEELAEAEKEEC